MCLIGTVITVSRHDLEDYNNNNGVATDLFCTGVIGHPEDMVLNQGPKTLIQNKWSGLQNKLKILSSRVQLRVKKDQHTHDARYKNGTNQISVVF